MEYLNLEREFKRWLYFDKEPNELLVSVATILANRLDTPPVWTIIIGPSSSLKSTILKPMEVADEIKMISTLTTKTLLSGYKDYKGVPKGKKKGAKGTSEPVDHSLLKELHNKTLVIKDFTTILTLRPEQRAEIFGQLRDAYDGFATRATGMGQIHHRAKFGLLAACTPAIEGSRQAESLLGERFVYFRNTQADSKESYCRVLNNLGADSMVGDRLRDAMTNYLNDAMISANVRFDDQVKVILKRWARRVVILRTGINRDSYTREIVSPVEQMEFGGRFLSQLATLYFVLTEMVNIDRAMRVTQQIAIGAIPSIRIKVLLGIRSGLKTRDALGNFAKISKMAAQRVVEELRFMGVVDRGENIGQKYVSFLNEVGL